MKITCQHNARDIRDAARDGALKTELWKDAPPFNVNPRGILIHRVRSVKTHLSPWGNHGSVDYWCGNHTSGEGVDLVEKPPKDRLLCANCERLAVEAGEPTAAKLAGRHVCIGLMRAFRLCCRNEGN